MNEPLKDYEAMTRQELRKDLEQYDYVTPAGDRSRRYLMRL